MARLNSNDHPGRMSTSTISSNIEVLVVREGLREDELDTRDYSWDIDQDGPEETNEHGNGHNYAEIGEEHRLVDLALAVLTSGRRRRRR
ncbi:hypothetical protein Q9L58_001941 [Maublancomyces gigas]|uniref:Uncharacterized protein n=1 Tax=Discina gigas TaxID=1032678 RepID=A0ABR3GT15_9PEZI